MPYYILSDGTPCDWEPYDPNARKVTKKEHDNAVKERARAKLREIFPPGSTAHVLLRRVSRSGMMRHISVLAPDCRDVTWMVAAATGDKMDPNTGGIRIGGCGMDMGFALVYSMSRALYPDGFGIAGKLPDARRAQGFRKVRARNPREAARLVAKGAEFYGRNGDRSGWDNDGGYAIRREWV